MLKLVLLPGMDGTGTLFADLAEALSGKLETVILRYPADQYLSNPDLEALVRAACPASEPYILLAESFSTPLAIRVAAANPPNLKGLILCAGFASNPLQGWRRRLVSWLAPVLLQVPLPDFAVTAWLVGPNAPSSLVMAVRKAIESVRPQVLSARMRAVLSSDVREELRKVAVPILYIQAECDRLVRASCLEEILRIKPQVTVATIPGPHLLLQREPQRSAAAVAEFVKGLT